MRALLVVLAVLVGLVGIVTVLLGLALAISSFGNGVLDDVTSTRPDPARSGRAVSARPHRVSALPGHAVSRRPERAV